MGFYMNCLTKSIWVFHLNTGACNNCDIEILDLLTPRFDVERFGIKLIGSVRHADALLITGPMTQESLPRAQKLFDAMPKPGVVIALGACGCSGGIFQTGYAFKGPVEDVLPVNLFVPGCPPKPEAMISGIVKLITALRGA